MMYKYFLQPSCVIHRKGTTSFYAIFHFIAVARMRKSEENEADELYKFSDRNNVNLITQYINTVINIMMYKYFP